MRVKIRPANTSDIDDIVRLWTELMEFHAAIDPRYEMRNDAEVSFREFTRMLIDGPDSTILCACANGEMVGFVSVNVQIAPPIMKFERFGMIQDEVVSAKCRRAGVGEKLFEAARDWCRKRGVSIIQLFASPLNPMASSFWRKMGFRPYLERLWYDIE